MKYIYSFIFKTIFMATLALTNGCISLTDKEVTIEKSEQITPKWAQENWQSTDHESIHFTFKKNDVYNLNLGIKQIQAAAQIQTSFLVMEKVQKTLLNFLPASSNISNKERNSLVNELSEAVSKNRLTINFKPVLPKAIYWEYRQKDTDNGLEKFYVIWVLLSVPNSDYKAALISTALTLTKSSSSDAVDLGQNILQKMTPP
ncbi:hypothetical protein [Fluviispira multicolorata]|uniref:Lipoprotein n=1 Tax=Fluviispira multicolorata TaxID=2654512 RepID=A0A833JC68_9BACT|nr:hypothetical protein [Fluviispira multicolorata]KAB8030646.1 hypothetical protein GCL57_06635 [Fluviispira multicolorata]